MAAAAAATDDGVCARLVGWLWVDTGREDTEAFLTGCIVTSNPAAMLDRKEDHVHPLLNDS